MANHVSAEKRNRQRIVRTNRNKAVRTSVRSTLRIAREAIASGNVEEAKAPVQAASIALAKAVSKGVVHKKAASRTISRIQSALAHLPA